MSHLICSSDELRSALRASFKGLPSAYRGVVLTKDRVASFIAESFPDLDAPSTDALTVVMFSFADTNSNGKIEPYELEAFLRDDVGVLPLDPVGDDHADDAPHHDEEPLEDTQVVFYETIMRNLGSDEVDMLRDAFIHMDMDSDGFVSMDEMLHVVRTVVGDDKFDALAEYLQPIFIVADKDRDSKLSLTEFLLSFAEGPGVVPTEVVNACVSSIRVRLTDEEIYALQERFRKIDTNGDGYIDPQELLVGLRDALGAKFPEPNEATYAQILNVVMALADTDHDGRLSLSEFIRSFQEDQGVLPAVFIDTSAQNALRRFTSEEELILKQVFADMGGESVSTGDLSGLLLHKLSLYVTDEAKARELCEIILAIAESTEDGQVMISELSDRIAAQAAHGPIPFVSVEERIEKVRARLAELLTEQEFVILANAFSPLHPQGYVDTTALSTDIYGLLRSLFPSHSDDFVSHLVLLVVSAGELDIDNTSKCSIDAFILSFAVAPEAGPVSEPDGSVGVAAHEGVGGSAAVPDYQGEQQLVVSNPSRPQTVLGYEGSPVRSDPSNCPITDSQLRREFARYDVEGAGFLDREAFKRAYIGMEHYGVEPTQSEVNDLFSRYSRGSNVISYEEFTVLMLHRSKM